ncbi:MAG TPA: hypothetical protein VGQ16_16360 [Vicinamibacterales bacterium]|nr:hypothetical protein [Vicinamibacterales bacterium]
MSLNDGLTILDLKPGNTVTLAALRQIIEHNGFVSKEAHVVARGTTSTSDGNPIFEVSGTRERLIPSSTPLHSEDDWRFTVPAPSK